MIRAISLPSILLLAACARPPTAAPIASARPVDDEPSRAALFPASDASYSAASGGVLEFSPGCVRVRLADGRHLLPGFLVRPVRWDPATRRLQVGAHHFSDGDAVDLGGSEADAGVLAAHWVVPPDPACRFDGVWVTGAFLPAESMPPASGSR